MDSRKYDLAVGIVLLIACFGFFIVTAALRMDPFIPVMMAIVSLLLAIAFFFMGLSTKAESTQI